MARRVVLVALAAGVLAAAAGSSHAAARPWLWQCEQIHLEEAKFRCYVRLLLLDIDRSGDPARELPRIDVRARSAGTSLAASCHVLMHQVGREWAREHHLTLAGLQRVVPRSSDPGCSAGFGMGLVMALGPEIILSGGRSAVATCLALPTRYRSYTCVHSIGHALMRGYHGALAQSAAACDRLGPTIAPDCEQGVFHDYWISLRGADETTRPHGAVTSPRVLCGRYVRWARPCWYRYFIEQPLAPPLQTAADLRRACRGLAGLQRSGCLGAAAHAMAAGPFEQLRVCGGLGPRDALGCVRGLADQGVRPRRRVALIDGCRRFRPAARRGCYAWLGLTLNVVSNGRFLRSGCLRLGTPGARRACAAGARRLNGPLVTFS